MAVNFYVAIPLMAVLAILQTAVLPRFPIAGLEPQLVFLVALAWGLLRGLEAVSYTHLDVYKRQLLFGSI